MSILELSNKIEVSYSAVYRLVHKDIPNPNLDTLLKVSKAFDLSVSQLIGETPIKNPLSQNSIKSIPLIKWEDVVSFLDNNTNIKTDNIHLLLPQNTYISEKCFALRANKKIEALFKVGSILIFDTLSKQIREYDDKFVLVSSNNIIPVMKKLYVEGAKVFLQSVNDSIPLLELLPNDLIIAHLCQVKMDF
jgi:SOS-response transcriptional repressor LexA